MTREDKIKEAFSNIQWRYYLLKRVEWVKTMNTAEMSIKCTDGVVEVDTVFRRGLVEYLVSRYEREIMAANGMIEADID